VGKTAQIAKLADASTKKIDLKGKAVIPGLIDNHAHWIRAAEHDELRFDGVTSRRQALKMLSERVRAARPGEWIVTLGGWSEDQFNDDPRGFRSTMDRIAPQAGGTAGCIRSYLAPRRSRRARSMRPRRSAKRKN
jgi:predicted amidohydrolase YtcJ